MPSSEKVVNYSSVTLWFAPISVFIAQQSTNLHQKAWNTILLFGTLFENYPKFIFWQEIQAIYRIEMLQKWTVCCKKGEKMVNSSLLSKPNYENVEVDFMVIFWTICITQRIWRDLTRRQIGKKGLHFPNWTISLAFELSENDFAKCCCWCRCSNFSFVSDGFGHSVCSRESNFDFS